MEGKGKTEAFDEALEALSPKLKVIADASGKTTIDVRKVGDAFVVGGKGVTGLIQRLKLSGKAFLALGKEMLAIYAPMLAIEVIATLIGKLIDNSQ